MTNKPVSADETLTRLYAHGRVEVLEVAEAKRHLAEAMEWIIGKDEDYAKNIKSPMIKLTYRNQLRAAQRKRLAEWLGGKDE